MKKPQPYSESFLHGASFLALEDLLQFAALVGASAIIDVETRRPVAVVERRSGKIQGSGQCAPAKIEAVGIALMDTKQPGTGTPPLVHHHQLFYAVPAGTEHVAAASLGKIGR